MSGIILQLAGQTLELFPQRAALWHEQSTLLVADCHFGKAAAFRHQGVAVPEGGTEDDLARMDMLIAQTGARQVLVVGDLFHAPSGYSPEVVDSLIRWRQRHPTLTLTLVPGNHDRALHRLPPPLGIHVVNDGFDAGGLRCVHDPAHADPASTVGPAAASPAVCGHWHPAIRLGDRRMRGMKAPCFWLRDGNMLVLPSFGSFTGHAVVAPAAGDRIFAVAGRKVVEVPSVLLGAGA